jgi:cytochrome c-type biogenesis protein CcsB
MTPQKDPALKHACNTLRSAFGRWLKLAAIAPLLLLTSVSHAQVRSAPEGNSLPQAQAIDTHAIEELAPSAGEDLSGPLGHGSMTLMSRPDHDAFATAVDLSAFRKLAVFDGGRVKILDTLAREQINRVYGKTRWKDADTGERYDPVFTYLDLIFNKTYYFDKPVIYVEVLALRRQLLATLPLDQQEKWLKAGRLAPLMFADPRIQQILSGMHGDLRLFKGQQDVLMSLMSFDDTGERLAMVSPLAGSDHWLHLSALSDERVAAADANVALPQPQVADPQAARAVVQGLQALSQHWRAGDAEQVNAALSQLSKQIPLLNPSTYPQPLRLTLEEIYNRTAKFTIGYVGYLIGAVTLLLAFAVGRSWLVRTGVAMLLIGFAVHTAGMLVRGILSGRWPIHNQFESFVAISWFAVGVGILLMFAKKQWLFGAAAAALGTCALLLANTYDIPSNEVGPVAGILATSRILYVHVNVVLASYALIAMSFFVSLFYLIVHYLPGQAALRFAAAGVGHLPSDADDRPLHGRQGLLHDLDRAQMVVMQLAFWLLIVGIALGAYWADHAWGRFWGWDPKETWALITWIIYLIAIHTRFVVKRRGLVTAWLSVAGFVVMLWTYWGVNMLLAGLHSYA